MKLIVALLLLAVTGCEKRDKVEGPTPAEAERLDDAEEMLNDLAEKEGAAPEGTAPTLNQQ